MHSHLESRQLGCAWTSHVGTGSSPWEPRPPGNGEAFYFYLFIREVETERAPTCWFTPQRRAGAGAGALSSLPSTCCLPGRTPVGSWKQAPELGLNPAPPIWDAGVFMATPSTCPRLHGLSVVGRPSVVSTPRRNLHGGAGGDQDRASPSRHTCGLGIDCHLWLCISCRADTPTPTSLGLVGQ